MFGLYILVLCSDMCHEPSSYYICAKKTYPQVGLIIDIVVFIKCFGVVQCRSRSGASGQCCYAVLAKRAHSHTGVVRCTRAARAHDRPYRTWSWLATT